ncbi:hypothetical protein ACIQMV_18910 [Streptomyces sp. NPDC091412]|uniref:hypothetical protein n=1 Tax=Streptomyces sp. NPDC091412 TaxID=3366002 RepID=UPI00382276C5
MNSTAVHARDTPGRTAEPQRVHGALFVDMDNVRARYECTRPGCPQPKEGPVFGDDVKPFVDGIKTQHLIKHHGGTP